MKTCRKCKKQVPNNMKICNINSRYINKGGKLYVMAKKKYGLESANEM